MNRYVLFPTFQTFQHVSFFPALAMMKPYYLEKEDVVSAFLDKLRYKNNRLQRYLSISHERIFCVCTFVDIEMLIPRNIQAIMTSSTPSITITPAGSTAAHPAPTISLSVTPVPPVPPRYKKPNYHVLHALPLPLTTTPLPPLIPHNPLSLLHIIVAYLFPGTNSHPSPLHVGIFHASTHAIHVTSQDTIKAFWNHGFFGKGSLSRSEPTWVIRRRRALGVIGLDEALTSEEVTERRRGERKEFKRERARAERERREKQLVEEGKIVKEADGDEGEAAVVVKSITFAAVEPPSSRRKSLERPVVEVEDLEHLQLTLEEAFFLAFGLGVLEIKDSETDVCPEEIYLLHHHIDCRRKKSHKKICFHCSVPTRTFHHALRVSSLMTRSCSIMLSTTTSVPLAGSLSLELNSP